MFQKKLQILKILCEMQFDDNIKFKNVINTEEADEQRIQPVGRDENGFVYWHQEDSDMNIRVYVEDEDEDDESCWKVVCRNQEDIKVLITQLTDEPMGKKESESSEEEDLVESKFQKFLKNQCSSEANEEEEYKGDSIKQEFSATGNSSLAEDTSPELKTGSVSGINIKKEIAGSESQPDVETKTNLECSASANIENAANLDAGNIVVKLEPQIIEHEKSEENVPMRAGESTKLEGGCHEKVEVETVQLASNNIGENVCSNRDLNITSHDTTSSKKEALNEKTSVSSTVGIEETNAKGDEVKQACNSTELPAGSMVVDIKKGIPFCIKSNEDVNKLNERECHIENVLKETDCGRDSGQKTTAGKAVSVIRSTISSTEPTPSVQVESKIVPSEVVAGEINTAELTAETILGNRLSCHVNDTENGDHTIESVGKVLENTNLEENVGIKTTCETIKHSESLSSIDIQATSNPKVQAGTTPMLLFSHQRTQSENHSVIESADRDTFSQEEGTSCLRPVINHTTDKNTNDGQKETNSQHIKNEYDHMSSSAGENNSASSAHPSVYSDQNICVSEMDNSKGLIDRFSTISDNTRLSGDAAEKSELDELIVCEAECKRPCENKVCDEASKPGTCSMSSSTEVTTVQATPMEESCKINTTDSTAIPEPDMKSGKNISDEVQVVNTPSDATNTELADCTAISKQKLCKAEKDISNEVQLVKKLSNEASSDTVGHKDTENIADVQKMEVDGACKPEKGDALSKIESADQNVGTENITAAEKRKESSQKLPEGIALASPEDDIDVIATVEEPNEGWNGATDRPTEHLIKDVKETNIPIKLPGKDVDVHADEDVPSENKLVETAPTEVESMQDAKIPATNIEFEQEPGGDVHVDMDTPDENKLMGTTSTNLESKLEHGGNGHVDEDFPGENGSIKTGSTSVGSGLKPGGDVPVEMDAPDEKKLMGTTSTNLESKQEPGGDGHVDEDVPDENRSIKTGSVSVESGLEHGRDSHVGGDVPDENKPTETMFAKVESAQEPGEDVRADEDVQDQNKSVEIGSKKIESEQDTNNPTQCTVNKTLSMNIQLATQNASITTKHISVEVTDEHTDDKEAATKADSLVCMVSNLAGPGYGEKLENQVAAKDISTEVYEDCADAEVPVIRVDAHMPVDMAGQDKCDKVAAGVTQSSSKRENNIMTKSDDCEPEPTPTYTNALTPSLDVGGAEHCIDSVEKIAEGLGEFGVPGGKKQDLMKDFSNDYEDFNADFNDKNAEEQSVEQAVDVLEPIVAVDKEEAGNETIGEDDCHTTKAVSNDAADEAIQEGQLRENDETSKAEGLPDDWNIGETERNVPQRKGRKKKRRRRNYFNRRKSQPNTNKANDKEPRTPRPKKPKMSILDQLKADAEAIIRDKSEKPDNMQNASNEEAYRTRSGRRVKSAKKDEPALWQGMEEDVALKQKKKKKSEVDEDFSYSEGKRGSGQSARETPVKEIKRVVNDDTPCMKCGLLSHPETILLCAICNKGHHMACLTPPLMLVPDEEWFCPKCSQEKLIRRLREIYDKLGNKLKLQERKTRQTEYKKLLNEYTGISASNIIDEDKPVKPKPAPKKKRPSSTSESDLDDLIEDSYSSPSSPEIKTRRCRTRVSYDFSSFDKTIMDAIKDDIDIKPGVQQEKPISGKDIRTIIAAEKGEDANLDDTKDVVMPGRRKKRKLTNLNSSESEAADSGSNYSMSSSNEEMSEEEYQATDESESEGLSDERFGNRKSIRGQKRHYVKPTKRSRRLRKKRIQEDFETSLSESSSDYEEQAPKKKRKHKKRNGYGRDSSEDTDEYVPSQIARDRHFIDDGEEEIRKPKRKRVLDLSSDEVDEMDQKQNVKVKKDGNSSNEWSSLSSGADSSDQGSASEGESKSGKQETATVARKTTDYCPT